MQGLAHQLMHRLATASQQSLVLQLPPLAARTPSTPVALAVVRGTAWHILCAVDDWNVIVTPPPALARFGRRWGWSKQGSEPVDALAASLGALADAWWTDVPDAVGALDVAGAITHAATAALGAVRGAIGNIVYGDPGRHGAEVTGRIGIARDHREPRWPYLADVYAQETAILVNLRDHTALITDVHQLARELPGLVERMRGTDDACERRLVALAALRAAVADWTASHPPPVPSSEWSVWSPSEINPDEAPTIPLYAKAFSAERFGVTVTSSAQGPRIQIGAESFLLDPAHAEAIAQAIEREARDARDPEMSDFERYR